MILTLTQKFEQIARESGQSVSMLFREGDSVQTYTYEQIYNTALKVARWLCQQGVSRGDRVAIALENRPEWSICYFGILLSGASAVPLDIQAGTDEIKSLLDRTQSKILFASAKLPLEEVANLDSLGRIVLIGKEVVPAGKAVAFSRVLESKVVDSHLPVADPEDVASIIYTSGTTGPPKGVVLTHKNFYSNFQSLLKVDYIRPADTFLSILPLHHAFPFMVTLIVPFFSKLKIVYLSPLKAEAILNCLREQKVTIFAVTPQLLQLFHRGIQGQLKKLPRGLGGLVKLVLELSWQISRLTGFSIAKPLLLKLRSTMGRHFRCFICGGAKLDWKIERDFFKWGFTILEGYGLTETSPVVSLNPPDKLKIGSVGKPVSGVEVKILNPDQSGVGEILIRGDNVMKGYYRNETATREVFRDGWFNSGDLGLIDSEGYLFIEGRTKEVIVLSSGKKVSAEEVESYYSESPLIKELCVFAELREGKLVAVVVPDLDHFRRAGESNIRDQVKWQLEYLSERLPPYKRLRNFILVDGLAKTRLGKVKRQEAIEKYEEQFEKRAGEREAEVEEVVSETGEKVLSVLRKETGVKNISVADHLELDLGIDSLGRVSLMTALEKAFDAEIVEEKFLSILTVSELIEYVEEQRGKAGRRVKKERSWDDILREDLPQDLLEKIDIEVGLPSRFLTLFVALVSGLLFKLYFRLKIYGRENLEKERAIICPNHTSYLDGFIVFCALPLSLKLRLFFLGLRGYFEVPIIRSMIKLIRIIPVDPSRNIIETMQASFFVLRNKKILCVFPEGARSIKGEVKEFKKGVSILAEKSGAKIIPAYISGSHRAWRANVRFPRPRSVAISFGGALSFEELLERGIRSGVKVDRHEAASIGLREAVLELKGKSH